MKYISSILLTFLLLFIFPSNCIAPDGSNINSLISQDKYAGLTIIEKISKLIEEFDFGDIEGADSLSSQQGADPIKISTNLYELEFDKLGFILSLKSKNPEIDKNAEMFYSSYTAIKPKISFVYENRLIPKTYSKLNAEKIEPYTIHVIANKANELNISNPYDAYFLVFKKSDGSFISINRVREFENDLVPKLSVDEAKEIANKKLEDDKIAYTTMDLSLVVKKGTDDTYSLNYEITSKNGLTKNPVFYVDAISGEIK